MVHILEQLSGHLFRHLVRCGGDRWGSHLQRFQQLGPLLHLQAAAHRLIALLFQQLAADRAVPEHGASLAMGAGLHGGIGVEGALGGAAPPVTPALMFEGLAAVNRRNAVDPTEVGEAEPGGGGSHDTVHRIGHIFL